MTELEFFQITYPYIDRKSFESIISKHLFPKKLRRHCAKQ